MTRPPLGPVAECIALVREGHIDVMIYRAWRLPPADLADVLSALAPDERLGLLAILPTRLAARALAELPAEASPTTLLAALTPETAADIIQALDDDAAAELLGAMPSRAREKLLAAVASRAAIDRLLQYRKDSAGRMMTTAVLRVTESDPIPLAVEAVRRQAREAGEAREIYVVDIAQRLTGVLSFQQLVTAPALATIRDVMRPAEHLMTPASSRRTVARALHRHRLKAIPVVDNEGHLLGCITADDGAHLVAREAQSTFLHFAGVVGEEERRTGVGAAVRSRLPTLYANLLTALGTVLMLHVGGTLAGGKISPALIWLPVLIGMGGNAGIQALASAQFRLAQGRLPWNRRRVVLGRELLVGLINGAMIGAIVASTALLVGASWQAGALLLVLLAIHLPLSGVLAAALPMLLRRAGFDPSLASAPTLTTLLDLTGMTLLLLLGWLLL